MSVSWCSSTDPENWPHCRHTGLSELRLRPCSHISNVWSSSHMLLNWFIVKLYHMPLILLNGPFFTFLSKCASIFFFIFMAPFAFILIYLYITAFQVNKMKSAQYFWLHIQQTFPLMILILSPTLSAPAGPFGTANILKSQCWVSVQRTVKGLFWKLTTFRLLAACRHQHN